MVLLALSGYYLDFPFPAVLFDYIKGKKMKKYVHEIHEKTRNYYNQKFLRGGPGGAVFSKRVPPWPPEA
jgi:hypothetical protein